MAMIKKINQLKTKSDSPEVKSLCETALAGLNSVIYNEVTPEAKHEIERVSVEKLFEGLEKINNPDVKTWVANQKRSWAVKNLGIRESINTLMKSEAKENPGLKETLEYFRNLVESDIPEVTLYESYLTAMQSFNYFPRVGNALRAIQNNVENYKSDVSIKRILEAMKESRSNYLIQQIEDIVQNYLDNKTEQNKSFLKECLVKYSYDPFIRDLINLVTLDATELQLEHANASCDIEKIYSPILYLGENEAVFSVRGLFYVKKGNTIARLGEKEAKRLDPEFVALCEAINSPNVIITPKNITVYEGKDKIVITSDKVIMNEKELTSKSFGESAEIAQWTGKGPLLMLVEILRRNFDEIAEVDFAKRVFLKEDENYAADVFKLRGNVFISTHNSTDGKSTFYRNINPIQAKGIMMNHLHYDVSRLFEGLLPEEEKILEEIDETKKDYTNYISLLQEKIDVFKSEFPTETTSKVLEALEEEFVEVKDEYKDYLNVVEKYVRPLGESITITVDVDGKKYTVPIPSNGGGQGEQNAGTEPGKEDMEKEPASAVTFQDDQTELLGDTPTISTDNVSMGSDQIGAEADKAEAEKEKGEGGEEGEEKPGEEGEEKPQEQGEEKPGEEETTDLEGGEKDKIKIEDEADKDEEGEKEEEEDKTEEATDTKTETKELKPEVPKKRRVFIRKKVVPEKKKVIKKTV